MNNCFIDSTIWVEFFRGKNKKITETVLALLDEDRIFYNGIVIGALLTRAMGKREWSFIKDNFDGLKYLNADKVSFEQAAHIGFKLKKRVLQSLSQIFLSPAIVLSTI
ncbi:hypothetical protein MNBD_UNCLBAC01-680 [hydrothermal vent metagenome]|uniref:PIN domain-containing protein n=1 Tax=hydrothermal vent metagenome TaxID=652676 RepID=A0A3B1CYQ0_9ZZZZ